MKRENTVNIKKYYVKKKKKKTQSNNLIDKKKKSLFCQHGKLQLRAEGRRDDRDKHR